MTVALAVLCGVLGLAVGSFLNVVIHRVPLGHSVVSPPSHCPGCDAPIRPRDNVPVLGWLLLRGRCRDCGQPISARYPLVEGLTAALFVVVSVSIGAHAELPAFLYLAGVGVALAAIDLDTKRLPNALTLPSYAVGLVLLGAAALVQGELPPFVRAVEGMAALYAFYFVLCYGTAGKGMGFGDVKLAGVLGLYLGWLGWSQLLVGSFAAFALGAVVSIGLVVGAGAGRKTRVPFGPFLVAGALLAVVAGAPIARTWLGAA